MNEDKGKLTIGEIIKCAVLAVVGVLCFGIMPDQMGIFGWVLFAVGTLLFIIGVFRFYSLIPDGKTKSDSLLKTFWVGVIAVAVQVAGFFYLYGTGGTGKGAAIATLTLCVSLGLVISVVNFDNKKQKNMLIIICRIISIPILAAAILLNIRDDFSNASIFVGTMLIIELFIVGKVALLPLEK
ncbi:hypothetical protein [Butyrivibrio sp. YAB3001]|uniref:hypothetical protein n=1 Tax=Butyrivibrio sp. YAB3001 TaxID=1520812 RepID=UPI0008F6362D|nr:hypothetical protein [Butyrivibrio sp. YAB3001]SFD08849.1 hypothetical protein SAMN02910398_04010 [Butyrivibrio sp. YAB3001]